MSRRKMKNVFSQNSLILKKKSAFDDVKVRNFKNQPKAFNFQSGQILPKLSRPVASFSVVKFLNSLIKSRPSHFVLPMILCGTNSIGDG